MKIRFIHHATFILEFGNGNFLIDPMLSAKDAMDPVQNCNNVKRIPMVELPLSSDELNQRLKNLDAVVVTHTHRDHWDQAARDLINKSLPVIIQPSDEKTITDQGFTNSMPVHTSISFKDVIITRTGGQHGTGEIGLKMGHVSGYIIEHQKKKVYIAGDTIWCKEVELVLEKHKPDVIVLNTGAAQFNDGDPITMTAEDVMTVIKHAGTAKVLAVHMETVNHCWLRRDALKKVLQENNLSENVIIPADGEVIAL